MDGFDDTFLIIGGGATVGAVLGLLLMRGVSVEVSGGRLEEDGEARTIPPALAA